MAHQDVQFPTAEMWNTDVSCSSMSTSAVLVSRGISEWHEFWQHGLNRIRYRCTARYIRLHLGLQIRANS